MAVLARRWRRVCCPISDGGRGKVITVGARRVTEAAAMLDRPRSLPQNGEKDAGHSGIAVVSGWRTAPYGLGAGTQGRATPLLRIRPSPAAIRVDV